MDISDLEGFNEGQIYELKLAIEQGVNYSKWFDHKWTWEQMEQFRLHGFIKETYNHPDLKEPVYLLEDDSYLFQNTWSSNRSFTVKDDMWSVGCFAGNGEELIKKAYEDSDNKGKNYELCVNFYNENFINESKEKKWKKFGKILKVTRVYTMLATWVM